MISGDLTEGTCDPIPAALPAAGCLTQPPDAPDACDGVCVRDCFCCSTTGPALTAFALPEPETASANPPEVAPQPASGFVPGADHVPKRLL